MTVFDNEDPALPEELPRDEEMDLLRKEVSDAMDTVQRYRSGNTALMEALMMMMANAPDGEAKDAGMNCLREAGMADESGALNWSALDDRKDNRWTWEQAVRMLVKQPAEVERLLRLQDEA